MLHTRLRLQLPLLTQLVTLHHRLQTLLKKLALQKLLRSMLAKVKTPAKATAAAKPATLAALAKTPAKEKVAAQLKLRNSFIPITTKKAGMFLHPRFFLLK